MVSLTDAEAAVIKTVLARLAGGDVDSVHSSSESTPGAKQSKGNAKAVRQADIQRLETELGSGFSQFLI